MKEEKEIYRVRKGKWIAGVCTGMAEYMNLPVVVVRCILVAMALFFGGGIFVYIASIFMIRWEPENADEAEETEASEEIQDQAQAEETEE